MGSLREYSKNIYETGKGSDFSIIVFDKKGAKIQKKVHKLIICRSPYFSAMLEMKGKESKEGQVTMDNITKDTMEHVLKYLYTDELSAVTMEQAIEITSAADYLQLDELKAASLDQWRKLVVKKEPNAALAAFRAFTGTDLRVVLDKETWHEAMELVLHGIYLANNYKVASETTTFMEYLITYFGSTHPYMSMDLLAQWTLGRGLKLTKTALKSRKQATVELLKKIDLQKKLTLRTLTRLSKSEAYPLDYMIQQIQKKSESKDVSVCGEVTYTILTKKNRTVELEHEAGYVLFQYNGFIDGPQYTVEHRIWRRLHQPDSYLSQVEILSPKDSKVFITWKKSAVAGGTFSEPSPVFSNNDGIATIKVILFSNDAANNQSHQYTMDYTA